MITSVLQSLSVPGLVPETRSGLQSSSSRTDTAASQAAGAGKKANTTGGAKELSEEEQKQAKDLERIDRHVRAHEAAHQGAAGGLAQGKSFTYEQGPDGKQYAVAGEVQIDTSVVSGDPRATAAKMQKVQASALSPSDPSPQDRRVAAQAARAEAQAQIELLEQQKSTDTTQPQNRAASSTDTTISSVQEQVPEQENNSFSDSQFATTVQRFAPPSFSGAIFNGRA